MGPSNAALSFQLSTVSYQWFINQHQTPSTKHQATSAFMYLSVAARQLVRGRLPESHSAIPVRPDVEAKAVTAEL
jgi:hypothetical protein